MQVCQVLQAPNPAANPPGTTKEWIQKHFVVKTTTTTVVVDESSSDDDWGEEKVENVAKRARKTGDALPADKPELSKQESETAEDIWGIDPEEENSGGWGPSADEPSDDDWGADPGAADDVWDEREPEDSAEEFQTYPCPPEEDIHACNSDYKGIKTVVDVLDYATASKRLVWLETEFQREVPYIGEWPLERVRKLLSAHDYDFNSVLVLIVLAITPADFRCFLH